MAVQVAEPICSGVFPTAMALQVAIALAPEAAAGLEGTVTESITALLAAGARPEIVVKATHGLFVLDAYTKLSHPAMREVFVTDTVNVAKQNWPQLRVISIAPLVAGAMQRFLGNGSLGELN